LTRKVALITGITGQDGAYLTEFLLNKGYEVHGIKRRTSLITTDRIDHLFHDLHVDGAPLEIHHGDMTDSSSLLRVVADVQPDEIYNLAAQSHVAVSFEAPEYTADSDGLGVLRLLEAVRHLKLRDKTRIYQASTSELFGDNAQSPQSETTPFYPRSPYGAAKLYAYWITVNYREAYGLFACNGIMFNHESPIRGETFITRKITRGLAKIVIGEDDAIYLGNLDSRRDWGHAKDYVEMQWLMLQQPTPDDFVAATGVQHTVREFVEESAANFGIHLKWLNSGELEVGVVDSVDRDVLGIEAAVNPGDEIIKVDPRYFRPTEVSNLLGDASKARDILGWEPKTSFSELVKEMSIADLDLATRQKAANNLSLKVSHGFDIPAGNNG
jgi:GDPmannose 4,6-dehydratase